MQKAIVLNINTNLFFYACLMLINNIILTQHKFDLKVKKKLFEY